MTLFFTDVLGYFWNRFLRSFEEVFFIHWKSHVIWGGQKLVLFVDDVDDFFEGGGQNLTDVIKVRPLSA